jgi:hypothetical protein
MRPPPCPIPSVLPDVDRVLGQLTQLIDKPRDVLCGSNLADMVHTYATGPVWLTGSTVWLPAVFNVVDYNTDFDLVFATPNSAQYFIEGILEELNQRAPGKYKTERKKFGSARLTCEGKPFMDVWALDGDESIAELLLSYPHDYQRAAFFMSRSAPVMSSLTRVVRLHKKTNTDPVIEQNFFTRTVRASGPY